MNKWSQTFISETLEKEYTISRQSIIRPVLQYCLGVLVSLCIMMIIKHIALQQWLDALVVMGLLLAFCSLYLISAWLKIHQWSLTILNIIVAFVQLRISNHSEPHYNFLQGSNFFMTHMIILFTSDFTHAGLQLIAIGTIHLSITIAHTSFFAYEDIVYLILCSIALFIILSRLNKVQRLSFMSGLKDIQWESILCNVIEERFYLFTYDQNRIRFELGLTNPIDHAQNKFKEELLTKFLRMYKIDNQTLEQYIFRRIKYKQNIQQPIPKAELTIRNKSIQHKIIYSELNVPEQTFLIVFQRKDSQEKLKDQQNNKLHTTQAKYTSMLYELISLAKLGLMSSSVKYLSKILLLSQNMIHSYQLHKRKLESIDIQKWFKDAIETFNNAQDKIEIRFNVQGQQENLQFQYVITAPTSVLGYYVLQLLQIIYRCTNKHDIVQIRLYMGINCDEFFLQIHNIHVIKFIQLSKVKQFATLVNQLNKHKVEYTTNNVVFTFKID